jgi:hypothetical protein
MGVQYARKFCIFALYMALQTSATKGRPKNAEKSTDSSSDSEN